MKGLGLVLAQAKSNSSGGGMLKNLIYIFSLLAMAGNVNADSNLNSFLKRKFVGEDDASVQLCSVKNKGVIIQALKHDGLSESENLWQTIDSILCEHEQDGVIPILKNKLLIELPFIMIVPGSNDDMPPIQKRIKKLDNLIKVKIQVPSYYLAFAEIENRDHLRLVLSREGGWDAFEFKLSNHKWYWFLYENPGAD